MGAFVTVLAERPGLYILTGDGAVKIFVTRINGRMVPRWGPFQ